VLAYAHEQLASYKAPRIVYLIDDLPPARNGKLLRRALRPEQSRARAPA
jgi:fatty-acyl-CoA synthase